MQTLIVEPRTVYGHVRYYPVNDIAILFTKLSKSKTLDAQGIAVIKSLGFSVELRQPIVEVPRE